MRRKIGVTTWIFGKIHLIEIADIIAQMGFDGVELFIDIAQYKPQDVKKVFTDKG
jgi:D-psicose/D-tagatose/L-ribulose 3-epimerase